MCCLLRDSLGASTGVIKSERFVFACSVYAWSIHLLMDREIKSWCFSSLYIEGGVLI